MAKTAGVVSIDGSDYDVASGHVVGSIKRAAKVPPMPTASQVIDGFIKRSPVYEAKAKKIKSTISGAKIVTAKRVPKSRRSHRIESASAVHRRAEHSKTLVRRGLSKKATTVRAATRTLANPAASLHKVVDPMKLTRAKMVVRSDKISRFGGGPASPAKSAKNPGGELVKASAAAASSKVQLDSRGSLVLSSSHQRLERMLDIALARADAHKRSLQNHRNWRGLWMRSRWASLTAVAVTALLIVSFFVWRDIPAVAIKLADLRAHVSATLPSYTPAGYHYSGPLNYSTGRVTVVYKDGANSNHAYSLSQQKSGWDSTTLQNSINNSKSQVQSSQAGGLTVYIYNSDSSAAWVNNGMLYTIQNKANLSSDQILNIAQSL